MQRYRSGHNEAVLKTVCPKGRVGSNPTLCANKRDAHFERLFLFCVLRCGRFAPTIHLGSRKALALWEKEKHMKHSLYFCRQNYLSAECVLTQSHPLRQTKTDIIAMSVFVLLKEHKLANIKIKFYTVWFV